MKKYTDQEFLYRQTPVNYDGIAKFTSIKGNTLGWNQLVPPLSAMSAQNGTLSVADNVATITSSSSVTYLGIATSGSSIVLPKGGHKYLLTCEFKSSKAMSSCSLVYGNNINLVKYNLSANTWTKVSTIASYGTPTGQYVQFRVFGSFEQGDTLQVKNWNYFDLTAMGLDSITTIEEFASLFPLPFYDYNQGTLIPFSGNGIKTVGKNLCPKFTNGTGANLTYTIGDDGSVKVTGTNTGTAFYAIPFTLPAGTYVLSGAPTNGQLTIRSSQGGGAPSSEFSGQLDDYGSGATFTVSETATAWLNIRSTARVHDDTYYPMIRYVDSDNVYEPYKESSLYLPVSNYFPTGMKRAGNVYDELTENKAITRIGVVDMGTLTWAYDSTVPRFYTQGISSIIKKPLSNNDVANITNVYKAVSLNGLYAQSIDKCIAVSNGGVVSVKDTSYSDLNSFRTAMSGAYLYYELATETETDAEDIFYKFYADGTEQLLPVNGSTPTTAPIIADIEYYNQIDSETPYRKFWLVNGNGDRWNLTEKELKSFLDSPQGLGFQKSIDVTRYGERAYKNTESYNFPQVSGDILFYDTENATRYEKYNEFVRFLMVQPLTLYYQIPVSIYSGMADIYTLDCEVINLTKTESKTNRVLTSNIQINGLGFYQGDTVEINGTSATVTINNDGDFPVGFEIELNGDFENPYITLEQDGELYGEAKFDDDGNNFSSVYVNSKDGEQNVVLKQNDSILPNPLAYQDLSISNGSVYVTFVKLAKGESTLTIGADSYSISNYSIKFTPMYRSV